MPDPGTGWQIVNWLWDRREAIAQSLARLYDWFRRTDADDRGILLIGPGGTGKTTLARLLTGQHDWLLDSPWEYAESLGVEEYGLPDDPTVRLVVPPGQHHRRATAWADVEADLAAGKYRGAIVLGSNGFHTLNQGYRNHPLYTSNKAAFLDAYTSGCRADELRSLDRVANGLRLCPRKVWLLSLVTKQDLWVGEEASVVGHYTNGPWRETVDRLAAAKDARLFRHELLFASLVIANFDTPTGERLRKNAEGYDQRAQVQSLRRVIEVLDALREWEKSP